MKRTSSSRRRWSICIASGGLLALMMALCPLAGADDAAPAATPAYQLGEIRNAKLAETRIISTSIQTTYQQLQKDLPAAMHKVIDLVKQQGATIQGGPILIYHSAPMEPDKQFTLEVAMPVKTDAPDSDSLRTLASVATADAVYTGSSRQIAAAYGEFFEKFGKTGLAPAGDVRERTLYWEGPDSPNNILLIEVEIKQ